MTSRKWKIRQRKVQVMKLQESQFKAAKSSVIQMSKMPVPKNKETLFSEAARIILGLLFIVFGVLLACEIIFNWNTYWSEPSKGIGVIILLADSISCVVLGVSLWREKDRNYIMSIYSALVALAALVVTIVK